MLRDYSHCSACKQLADKVVVFPTLDSSGKPKLNSDFEICGKCLMAGILELESPVRKQQKYLEVEGQLHDDTYVQCSRSLSMYALRRLLPGYWSLEIDDEEADCSSFIQTWQENEKGQRLKPVHYQVPSTVTRTKYEVDDAAENPDPGTKPG